MSEIKNEDQLSKVRRHPIYGYLAGVVTGAYFMWQFGFPAYLGNERYFNESARDLVNKANTEKSAAEKDAAEVRKLNSKANAEAERARQTARDALQKGLFPFGNPYPIGLARVRIGDPLMAVDELYGHLGVDKSNKSFWIAKSGHELFGSIAYFGATNDRATSVWRILYFASADAIRRDKELLARNLTASLGHPTRKTEEEELVWELPTGIIVEHRKGASFSIAKMPITTGSIKR